jgi:hypothetical protein
LNLKKIAYLLLAVVIIIGSFGLVACGGEEDGDTSQPSSSQTQTSPPESSQTTSPPETSQTSSPASGGGMTWDDVPVYPGADQVLEQSWAIPPAEEEWSEMEWKYFESGDSISDITEFYKDKMPDNGWEEMFFMDAAGGFAMGMYMKNNEKDGAMIWAGENQGKTGFALMRGTQ